VRLRGRWGKPTFPLTIGALADGAPEDVAALYQDLRRAVRRIRGSQKLLWSCIYASDLPWTK